jgi:hypothetical protein
VIFQIFILNKILYIHFKVIFTNLKYFLFNLYLKFLILHLFPKIFILTYSVKSKKEQLSMLKFLKVVIKEL